MTGRPETGSAAHAAGAYTQRRGKTLGTLYALEAIIQVADLTDSVAHHCGNIRTAPKRASTPIGNNDLWIAAHASANNWTVITNNQREFDRIEGLRLENWASS